jgi:hypothetical protein
MLTPWLGAKNKQLVKAFFGTVEGSGHAARMKHSHLTDPAGPLSGHDQHLD